MSNELVQTGFFDLELDSQQKTWHIGLDDKLQSTLRQRAQKIKAVNAYALLVTGEELAAAQQDLTYKNGGFVKWAEEEAGIEHERAYEAIHIWEGYKMLAESANISSIGKSVLLESSKKDVPQSARQEIVTRHEAGEKITLAVSDEIIERHKAELAKLEYENKQLQSRFDFYKQDAKLREESLNARIDELEERPEPEPKKITVYEDTPETKAKLSSLKAKTTSLEEKIERMEGRQVDLAREARNYEQMFRETQEANSKYAEENKKLSEEAKRRWIEGQVELDQLRVRQEWRKAVEKFLEDIAGFMAKVPALIDRQAFESDDWSRYGQCIHVVEQALSLLKSIQTAQSNQFIDATPIIDVPIAFIEG